MENISNAKEKRVIITRIYEVGIGGGTPPVIEPKTITENGTYTAPVGVDGFSPVVVNVPASPAPILIEKNIVANGTYLASAENADGFSKVNVDVPSGGAITGEWQPQPDWFDIEAIFKADPDPKKRYIILLTDSLPTLFISQSPGGYYKTSDGSTPAHSTTHNWDISKDKPCSRGYKTRWLMVYGDGAQLVGQQNSSYLYIYFGNNTQVTPMSQLNGNVLLEYIKFESGSFWSGNIIANSFQNCRSLQGSLFQQQSEIAMSFGTNAFDGCTSIKEVHIPNYATTIPNNTFLNCYSLKRVRIPSSVTSFGATNPFAGCASLLFLDVEVGWVSPAINLSPCTMFPESSAIELFTRLGNAPTARTLTFGATLLNRWQQSTKDIAINKGYILA